ncbi:HofP DNA utilization family protein [Enterobacter asburiae]|uniref:HofP DNA utilization family protein n=1 Tax=Enterobacter cloacae complex TaxID=354276 RepID=UPI0035690AFD
MRNSARYLLVCSALLLTGMRDPFRPPDDPCAIGELAQWRYRGMVGGQQAIGILQDGQKRWYRLKTHERFPAGWTITAINETELVVDVGDTCEPGTWTWQREGTDKNEFTDNAVADGVQPSAVGRRAKTGHAGGG